MAHFAKLDENNVVTQVIVVSNNELMDGTDESEARGIAFCQSLYGADTRWVQTSYNNNFRVRYAGIGYTFDDALDAFIKPKPANHPSWVVDPVTTEWVPPIARPTDTVYKWDEPTVSWVAVPQPYPSWIMQGSPLYWSAPVPLPQNGKEYRWDESTLSWIEVE
jgi:hypothetical protein